MAKVIWKYEIPDENPFEIEMPKGALILKAALQRNRLTMWAAVDAVAEKEKRSFFLVGTGAPVNKAGRYIDPFLIADDSIVLHLFEATKAE
jgi:hypothetical protein